MFGALLTRVADPFTLMSIFHFLYVVATIVTALAGIFGLLAGLALLSGRASARSLSLAAGFLSLCDGKAQVQELADWPVTASQGQD